MSRAVTESERLALRELRRTDLDFVAQMLADPEVMRFYPKCHDRSEAEHWLDRQIDRYSRDGHALWLTVRKRDLVPVGQVGLVMQWVDDQRLPEVGYLLDRAFWHQGYATEAARATRDHALLKLGYSRVVSLIRPENEPSRRVATRLRMQERGRTVHAGMEHLVYSITRTELMPRSTATEGTF